MPDQQQGFAIGVDLGTSNTVAVMRWPDGRTRPLMVDGAPIMPSGVYADESGHLHVGRDAQRMAQLDPARFEPNPKRRIDDTTVFLGGRDVPTADLLAALLGAVGRAAVEAVGFLPPAVLTYPASWGGRRRETLATAARRAGWPATRLVPEPVAAARYFADVLRRPVPVGSCLAVFDFGGGTLDVAVVRNDNGRFTVLGSGGIEDLGGLDIDAALVEHLGGVLAESAPEAWRGLVRPETTTQRRDRRLFWEDVRGAKEMLSRTAVAPIGVPGRDQAVHLTREELERAAQPLLRRAVYETAAVIQRCGLRPDQLAGLFLVGGSSRLPIAARLLHSELGIAPTVLEQPELPVAEGALADVAPPTAAGGYNSADGYNSAGGHNAAGGHNSVGASAPVSGTPPVSSAYPVSSSPGAASPVSPVYRGSTTYRAGYATNAPVSPAVAAPGSGAGFQAEPGIQARPGFQPGVGFQAGPGSQASPGFQAPPGSGSGAGFQAPPGSGSEPSVRKAWYARTRTWVAATATVLVVPIGATVALVLQRDEPTRKVDFATMRPGVSLDIGQADSTFSATYGDRTYVGWAQDETFRVAAFDHRKNSKLWGAKEVGGVTDARWQSITALPNAIVLRTQASGTSATGLMIVLDPSSGTERWRLPLGSSDVVYAFDSVVVVYVAGESRLRGLTWDKGNQKWERRNPPSDSYSNGEPTETYAMRTTADERGPSRFSGVPAAPDPKDDRSLVQIGKYSGRAWLLDGATGAEKRAWQGVGESNDMFLAHQGRLFVGSYATPYKIQSYELGNTAQPETLYTAPDTKRRLLGMSVCGEDRLCVLDSESSADDKTQIAAIDLAGKKQAWRKGAPGADTLIRVGDRVLASNVSGTAASYLFAPDGKQLLSAEDAKGLAVRVNASSLLIFSKSVSDYPSDLGLVGVGADGKRTALGPLSDVRGSSCSWNEAVIVCATATTFQVWRFVAS